MIALKNGSNNTRGSLPTLERRTWLYENGWGNPEIARIESHSIGVVNGARHGSHHGTRSCTGGSHAGRGADLARRNGGWGSSVFLPSPNPNFQEALLAMAAGTYSEMTNGPSSLLFLVKSPPATLLSLPHRPSHAPSRYRVSFRCSVTLVCFLVGSVRWGYTAVEVWSSTSLREKRQPESVLLLLLRS